MDDEEVLKSEPKWYVLHTLTGYESMVENNLNKTIESLSLQDYIVEVKVPMEDAIEEKNGKKKVVQRKMYPCYVFIKMRYTDNLWHTVVNTRGVTGFVGPAGRPIPLPDEEVAKMGLGKVKINMKVEAGNKVKVVLGPLEGFVGDVISVDTENQKCKVAVEMFGRQTPVDLDFSQIEII